MTAQRHVARDISYAYAGQTAAGQAMIRFLENTTGRVGLIRRAKGYEIEVAAGADFWQIMPQRFGLSLQVMGGSLEAIPRGKPLILIANHPYGILDGMMMGHILSTVRGDFRILAHRVFQKSDDLKKVILPISFDEDRAAVALNLDTRNKAMRYLQEGGAIGIFPGGTVSTSARMFSRPMDPVWRNFTARMIARSGAQVVPVFFHGQTSRLFQIASHLHYTLRMGLLIREFARRVDQPLQISIGAPIPPEEIRQREKDSKALMDFLRKSTYELSPTPIETREYGYEFEEKHKAEALARQQAFKR